MAEMREFFLIIMLFCLIGCSRPATQAVMASGHDINSIIPPAYTGTWKVKNASGQIISEENYFNGQRHGLMTQWYANGKKMRESFFSQGQLSGMSFEWWDNGKKLREVSYSEGLKNGIATEYNVNGQLVRSASFQNDVPHGICREWFDNGKKLREFHYDLGKRHGPYTQWNDKGFVKVKKWYRSGVQINEPQVSSPSPKIPINK